LYTDPHLYALSINVYFELVGVTFYHLCLMQLSCTYIMLCMLFIHQGKYQYIFTESACMTLNCLTETAVNIGYSCQLLSNEMADIFIIDGHTYGDVESQLGKFREAVRSASLGYDLMLQSHLYEYLKLVNVVALEITFSW